MTGSTTGRPRARAGRAALTAALVAPATLIAPSLAAAAPTIAADAVCVRPAQERSGQLVSPPLTITGSGFGPGARVELRRGARTFSATAAADGTLSAQLSVLDLLTARRAPGSSPFSVVANDLGGPSGSPAAQGASNEVKLRAAPLAFSASPVRAKPSARVTFRLSGLAPDRMVYAHYRFKGTTRANVPFGRAGNPCGLLTTTRRQIPVKNPQTGLWRVQFDHNARFSPTATPRVAASINVYRTIVRR